MKNISDNREYENIWKPSTLDWQHIVLEEWKSSNCIDVFSGVVTKEHELKKGRGNEDAWERECYTEGETSSLYVAGYVLKTLFKPL